MVFTHALLDPLLPVFDHGYVGLVEAWGSDAEIVAAARMSTDGNFRGWGISDKPGDERLLKHLYTHGHTSPFEMAGAQFEVQAPLFVFREWQRHRTQSFSELSARYTQMPDLHYVPEPERVQAQSRHNKQGSNGALDPLIVDEFLRRVREEQAMVYENYQWALDHGIAREVARLDTPVSRYSRMRTQAVLKNWLDFLRLRQSEEAQAEIHACADIIDEILTQRFPRTMELFHQYTWKMIERE